MKNLDLYFTPYTRINSQWVRDLNVKYLTMHVLKENIARGNKSKNCNSIIFFHNKDKREITYWVNIFATYITNKWLISLIYKEPLKLGRLGEGEQTLKRKSG